MFIDFVDTNSICHRVNLVALKELARKEELELTCLSRISVIDNPLFVSENICFRTAAVDLKIDFEGQVDRARRSAMKH